ncbi:MAG: hypothetical protein COS28_06105 [Nitrospirae bacterium CG02_land_8_20_14_3_00_44_33]|nr:MAG: hypothetical protein COS28_06105 [Nitrospirae bacterium CG02_land_8_20_14_3_00_44_33]PIV66581.1 MAG: hypothetical protein COS10_05510 [Nitrospirae bacterium CG01_land_8_20_14_3_00_44_22]
MSLFISTIYFHETAKTAMIVALMIKLRIILRSRDILPYIITNGLENENLRPKNIQILWIR